MKETSILVPNNMVTELPEPSNAEVAASYQDTIRSSVFIGEMPFESIMESIEAQFNDYVGTDDTTDYVFMFYNNLDSSYTIGTSDELFAAEHIELLDNIHDEFVTQMNELFNKRIGISIVDIDNENLSNREELESIISILYKFFILNARKNLTSVITSLVRSEMTKTTIISENYQKELDRLVNQYSGLITSIGASEFLELAKAGEISKLYAEGKVSGNFLRKFSAKLYQNEDVAVNIKYSVDLINKLVYGVKNRNPESSNAN